MLQLIPFNCLIFTNELENFDCEHNEINEYFKKEASQKDGSNTAKTFVLINSENIVGFYTLTVDSIDVRNLETHTSIKCPIVNLAYFAIDKKYQRRGYGSLLMQEVFRSVSVISYYTGVEQIYLESVDDSIGFYESLGFQLVTPNLKPEIYKGPTDNIPFPMYISINTLLEQGYAGYSKNFENVKIKE